VLLSSVGRSNVATACIFLLWPRLDEPIPAPQTVDVRRGRLRSEATEAAIVVAIGRAYGTILLARLCREAANLARRHGERTLMVVRMMAGHGGDQEFEIVGHTMLGGRRGATTTTDSNLVRRTVFDIDVLVRSSALLFFVCWHSARPLPG
jgi:hypothetical protein